MADNYVALQQEVLRQLVRDTDADAIARCPEWIANYESRARRDLRPDMGQLRSQNLAVTGAYTTLPSDYRSHKSVKMLSGTENELVYMPQAVMDATHGSSTSANPTNFCIVGGAIRLSPAPLGTLQVELTYYALASLSDVVTYNWLLLNHPDAYFYGTLCEAAGYYNDDAKEDRWWSRSDAIHKEINRASSQFRSGSPLQASANLPRVV